MSEPPLKKKRTILDFFTNKGNKDKKEKKLQKRSKEKTSMATGASNVATGVSNFATGVSNVTTGTSNDATGTSNVATGVSNVATGASNVTTGNAAIGNTFFNTGSFSGASVSGKMPDADSGPSTSGTESKDDHEKRDIVEPGTSTSTPDLTDPTVTLESDASDAETNEMTDSQEMIVSQDIPSKKPSERKDGSQAWKGIPLKILNKSIDVPDKLDTLQRTDQHRVLFKTPFVYDGKSPPKPFPSYKDKWDAYHVRMPCSNFSEYPTVGRDGKPLVRRRWEMIQEALLGDIPGPYELEEKILSYNSRYFGKWSFSVLHSFFIENLATEERDHFFKYTLKRMASLALQLPHLCTAPVPLLRANRSFKVTMSQQQIACLLANAFFCTFPRRNAKSKNSEYNRFPNINFNSLFMGQPSNVKFEKLRCILHYFTRIFKKMPCGTVTFHRQCMEHMPDWENDDTTLKGLHVASEGTIEDDGLGMLQVDFANMYLGGGVLGHGCVQEEIRMLICPEMLISRLITECLNRNECLIMTGCERFSNYDGYASSFVWEADYVDNTQRDSWGRIKCDVVAIDALVMRDYKAQFQAGMVKRELNKAYCGFAHLGKTSTNLPAVCTGNWGCGAFGGEKQLKALIQLMAAAKAGRDLCYFTFDNEIIRDQIFAIHKYLTSDNVLAIGDLLKLIEQYRRHILKSQYRPELRLYGYIRSVFDGGLDDTDEDSNQSLEMQRLGSGVTCDNDIDLGSDELLDDDITTDTGNLVRQGSVDYKANTP